MKILKLLNRKNFSILIICLLFPINIIAEDKPVDLWNLEKNETDINEEKITSNQNQDNSVTNSIYEMQSNKKIDQIELDQAVESKEIKIFGLYDPDEYGLSMDMWSSSDGTKLKNLFRILISLIFLRMHLI